MLYILSVSCSITWEEPAACMIEVCRSLTLNMLCPFLTSPGEGRPQHYITVKSKIIKPKQKKTVAEVNKEAIEDETAYERVLRKVNERKAARDEELIGSQSNKSQVKTNKKGNNSKIAKQSRQQSISPNEESDSVNARFLEDDNYVDMDISGIRSVFPSKDEDEESEY